MSTSFFHLAPFVAECLLNAIPGGLLIAVLAWIFLRVAGRLNSGARFAVWFGALLAVAGLPLALSVAKGVPVTQAVPSKIVLPEFWAAAILLVWILVAALAIARIVAGLWKLRRLRNGSVPLQPSNLTPPLQEIVVRFQGTRQVGVRISPAVNVPTAIGFFRPAILLPEWALRDLSEEELKIVLLHEFAHLRRWDDWSNLAQKLVNTVFFFHPAVWWIEKKLSLEREMACDEVVLAETRNPRAYAECLVSLIEKSFMRRGLALAQAVVGRARETSLRLARILDGSLPDSSRIFKPALGLATAVAASCLIALPGTPRLVAFENAPPARSTHSPSVADTISISQSQWPKAAFVPAVLRGPEIAAGSAATRKSSPVIAAYHPAKLSGVRNETESVHETRPVMIRASALGENFVPELIFVMQTAEYDERGDAMFSVCVWRVTVEDGNRQTIQRAVIMDLL